MNSFLFRKKEENIYFFFHFASGFFRSRMFYAFGYLDLVYCVYIARMFFTFYCRIAYIYIHTETYTHI